MVIDQTDKWNRNARNHTFCIQVVLPIASLKSERCQHIVPVTTLHCDFKFNKRPVLSAVQLVQYFLSWLSGINKRSCDYWQSKPPSACVGQPAPLNPSKCFCAEIGSGCVCMSASTSSRGHSTPTHRHTEGIWAAECNWSQEYLDHRK